MHRRKYCNDQNLLYRKKILYRTDSIVPYQQYCSVPTVLYRTNSIVPYGNYCTVLTLLYPKENILPSVQYCIVRTVLFIKNSIVPYEQYCSVRTVFLRTDTVVPYGHFFNVPKVLFYTQSWESNENSLFECFNEIEQKKLNIINDSILTLKNSNRFNFIKIDSNFF